MLNYDEMTEKLPNSFSCDIQIQSGICDSLLRMKPEAAMLMIQDMAAQHATLLGIDDPNLKAKDNALWVISRTKMIFNDIPQWYDVVTAKTWPSRPNGIRCERNYSITKDGNLMIAAFSEWVIIDADTRKLRKVETTHFPSDNEIEWLSDRIVTSPFRRIKDDFTEDDLIYSRMIRSSDIDITHHTNNAVYCSMFLDTFRVADLESWKMSEIEVSYHNESIEGEILHVYRKHKEDGYYFAIKNERGMLVTTAFILFSDR